MKEKFQKYLDKKFKKVRITPEIEDLKDEIMCDLLEKSEEVKKVTKDEDENYEICINSLGDLYVLVKEIKRENNKLANRIELPKYRLSEELINVIGSTITIALLCLICYFIGYINGAGK